jgi:hypothetical protein
METRKGHAPSEEEGSSSSLSMSSLDTDLDDSRLSQVHELDSARLQHSFTLEAAEACYYCCEEVGGITESIETFALEN